MKTVIQFVSRGTVEKWCVKYEINLISICTMLFDEVCESK